MSFTDKFCDKSNIPNYNATLNIVKQHLSECLELFDDENEIAFIALRGSQNYQLDTEFSDVDTTVVTVPRLEYFIKERKPINTVKERVTCPDHINIKDIRIIISEFKKANPSVVEILFSPWILVNEKYLKDLAPIFENRNLISNYYPYQTINTVFHTVMTHFNRMFKESRKDDQKYIAKALYQVIRLDNFLLAFCGGETSYKECLLPVEKNLIMEVKGGKYSIADMNVIAIKYKREVESIVMKYYAENPESIYNEEAIKLLDDAVANAIKTLIKDTLTE